MEKKTTKKSGQGSDLIIKKIHSSLIYIDARRLELDIERMKLEVSSITSTTYIKNANEILIQINDELLEIKQTMLMEETLAAKLIDFMNSQKSIELTSKEFECLMTIAELSATIEALENLEHTNPESRIKENRKKLLRIYEKEKFKQVFENLPIPISIKLN